MQPGTPHFSGGETTSCPNIDTFGRYFIIFGPFFANCRFEQTAILAEGIFTSLYLALVYLKLLPELGLVLPLQRNKLSDVMAADY